MITGYNTLMYEMWFRQRRWRRDLHLTTSFRISSSFMFCQYNIYLHTKWEFACSVLYKVSSTCVTDGNFSDFSFIQYLTRKLSSSPSINRKDMNWYPNFHLSTTHRISVKDTNKWSEAKKTRVVVDGSLCVTSYQQSVIHPHSRAPEGFITFLWGWMADGWMSACNNFRCCRLPSWWKSRWVPTPTHTILVEWWG